MRLTSLNFVLAAAAQVAVMSGAPNITGTGTAAQAADMVVPPPLSRPKAAYYAAHPAEWNAILANAPTTKTIVPAPPAPKFAPVPPGTWSTLLHTAPSSGMSNPLLLTDGSVIVHASCSANWFKLTPDENGSYIYGTWRTIANAPWQPLYFASQILNDGRVVGNGGEYDGAQSCSAHWITGGGIYNPASNVWINLPPPPGWTTIGDAQSIILPNTTYMLADCCSTQQARLNPATLAWTATGSGKFDENDEEGWALLQDGRVLTVDAYVGTGTCGLGSELYSAFAGAWTAGAAVTTQLSDCLPGGHGSFEVGPVVVRPSGTAVAFSGATTGPVGTSIFNPASNTWTAGPSLTVGGVDYNLADAPAVALTSGSIFYAASAGLFTQPTHFFEFTGANTIVQRADPAGSLSNPSYVYNFLLLPTGQVLMTDFSNNIQIYTPFGTFANVWRPTIASSFTSLTRGVVNALSGTQLNGITHGVYGDDQQASTNFPLVQLVNQDTNNVYYAKTSGFSNRSILRNISSRANFVLPRTMPVGTYSLKVISNGIPSASMTVTVN